MDNTFTEGVSAWKVKLGHLRDEVRQNLVAKQLNEYLPNPSEKIRILDIGCGQGTQAIRLAQMGFTVVGVDPSVELLELAKKDSRQKNIKNIKFFKGTLELPPPEMGNDFDIVCCHGVLMYLPKLELAISQLVAVTRPGGIISTLTRNSFNIAMRAGMSGDWQGAVKGFDAKYYDNRVGVKNVRADEPQEVIDALEANNAKLLSWFGVRLYTDHLDGKLLPSDFEIILQAEEEAGRRDPYRQLAALTHIISRKNI